MNPTLAPAMDRPVAAPDRSPRSSGRRRGRPTRPRAVCLRRGRLIALALLPAVLLAGCGPAPAPSPTPTSYTCTPEAGGDAYPCTVEEHATMVALDGLYAEAEAVYRRHMTEVFRLSSHWELADVTPEIEATAAGPYLETLTRLVASNRADQIRRISGEPEVAWLKRLPGKSLGGSIVALWSCIDGTSTVSSTTAAPHGQPGITVETRIYFRRMDEALKLWESETKLVESC